jgi:hypothetical protein
MSVTRPCLAGSFEHGAPGSMFERLGQLWLHTSMNRFVSRPLRYMNYLVPGHLRQCGGADTRLYFTIEPHSQSSMTRSV